MKWLTAIGIGVKLMEAINPIECESSLLKSSYWLDTFFIKWLCYISCGANWWTDLIYYFNIFFLSSWVLIVNGIIHPTFDLLSSGQYWVQQSINIRFNQTAIKSNCNINSNEITRIWLKIIHSTLNNLTNYYYLLKLVVIIKK